MPVPAQGVSRLCAALRAGLRFSFNPAKNAQRVERAVRQAMADGLRTGDIFQEGCTRIGCKEMMAAVAAAL